jgi:tripartite-type tricarboxylate transporter receptor subunit TctC
LSWGHSGIGSAPQLAGLLFAKMAGIETIAVSYRGGGLVVMDLVSGRLDYGFPTAPSVLPQVQEGRVRALAVPSANRSRLLPDVPTVAESGLPGYEVPSWYAFVVPAGTPQPIIARLNEAVTTALRDPGVVEVLSRSGLEPMPSTPEEMARALAVERARWEPVIRESGIRID